MFKNVASQKIAVFAFTPADGLPKTGDAANLTAYVSKDFGAVTVLGDTSATEQDATNAPGWYLFDLTQAETNADNLLFTGKSSTSGVKVVGRPVDAIPSGISTLDAAGIRAAVGLASANLDTQLTAIDDYIDTEVAAIKAKTDNLPSDPADASDIAAAFSTVNSTLSAIAAYVDTEVAAIKAKTDNLPSDPADASDIAALFAAAPAAVATAVWTDLLAGSDFGTAASVGKLIKDDVNATISSRATQTSVDTIDDFLDTEVAAIKAKTDNLPSDPADASDVAGAFTTVNTKLDTIDDFLDTEIAAIKAKTDNLPSDPADASVVAALIAAVASDVWDEDLTTHTVPDSTGEALAAAGSAGDPWITPLPGAYGAGTAGKIVGDNLNATVSSRATQTSVDAIDDYVDTEVAAIKAKTDNLPSDPADASDIAALFVAINAKLDTIDDFLDTEIAAIKAKTDNLPSDPADASDIAGAFTTVNTKLDTIDDFLDTEIAAIKAKTDTIKTATEYADALLNRDMGAVSDTNARSPLNALRFLRNKWDAIADVLTVCKEDDSTTAWTGALTPAPGGDPISGVDPA